MFRRESSTPIIQRLLNKIKETQQTKADRRNKEFKADPRNKGIKTDQRNKGMKADRTNKGIKADRINKEIKENRSKQGNESGAAKLILLGPVAVSITYGYHHLPQGSWLGSAHNLQATTRRSAIRRNASLQGEPSQAYRFYHYDAGQGAHLLLCGEGSLFAILARGLAMVCAGCSLLKTNTACASSSEYSVGGCLRCSAPRRRSQATGASRRKSRLSFKRGKEGGRRD